MKTITIPTSLPCPSWCTRPAGHGFDQADVEYLTRAHTAAVTQLEIISVEGFSSHVTVGIMSVENAVDVDGPVADLGDPNVYLDADGDFTGVHARQIAAALLNAADVWDEATR